MPPTPTGRAYLADSRTDRSQEKHLSEIFRLKKRTPEEKADPHSTSATARLLAEEYNGLWKKLEQDNTPRHVQQQLWREEFVECWGGDRGLGYAFHAELRKHGTERDSSFLPYNRSESKDPRPRRRESFTRRKDRSRSRSPIDSTGRLSGTSSLRGDVYRTSRRKHRGRGEIYYDGPNSAESFPSTAETGRLGLASPVQSADKGEWSEVNTCTAGTFSVGMSDLDVGMHHCD